MSMGCASAVPVLCRKTSELNFLLYRCEFIVSEQFNKWGEETIVEEGDVRSAEYVSLETYGVEQKWKNWNPVATTEKMVPTSAEWLEAERQERIPAGQSSQSVLPAARWEGRQKKAGISLIRKFKLVKAILHSSHNIPGEILLRPVLLRNVLCQ